MEKKEKRLIECEAIMRKMESERLELLDDMDHFGEEKKKMEKKWRERSQLIETLEHKVRSISKMNDEKETNLNRKIQNSRYRACI